MIITSFITGPDPDLDPDHQEDAVTPGHAAGVAADPGTTPAVEPRAGQWEPTPVSFTIENCFNCLTE